MGPYLTGAEGAITLAAEMLGGLVDWSAEVAESEATPQHGQGDTWNLAKHVRNRWGGRATLELPETNYESYMPAVGTVVAFVGNVIDDELTDFLTGNVRITRAGIAVTAGESPEKVRSEVEFEGVGAPTLVG